MINIYSLFKNRENHINYEHVIFAEKFWTILSETLNHQDRSDSQIDDENMLSTAWVIFNTKPRDKSMSVEEQVIEFLSNRNSFGFEVGLHIGVGFSLKDDQFLTLNGEVKQIEFAIKLEPHQVRPTETPYLIKFKGENVGRLYNELGHCNGKKLHPETLVQLIKEGDLA